MAYSYTSLMILIALLEYFWFSLQVGQARGRTGVAAPAMSGHPEFDRYFRIHYNTLEQLVMLIPAAFIFAGVVGDKWAAGIVAIFIVGRFIYATSYAKDPATRGLGFGLSAFPTLTLVIGSIVAIVLRLVGIVS